MPTRLRYVVAKAVIFFAYLVTIGRAAEPELIPPASTARLVLEEALARDATVMRHRGVQVVEVGNGLPPFAVITSQLRAADGFIFKKVLYGSDSARTRTRMTIKNREGSWQIIGDDLIKVPEDFIALV
jgi:hypothetical protein